MSRSSRFARFFLPPLKKRKKNCLDARFVSVPDGGRGRKKKVGTEKKREKKVRVLSGVVAQKVIIGDDKFVRRSTDSDSSEAAARH